MSTSGLTKIVCATDFSSGSTAALNWAAAIAASSGDSIDLVNVVAPPAIASGDLIMDGVVDDALLSAATERLKLMATAMEHERGISVMPRVLSGDVHRAIVDHAESVSARLIVLGAGGHSKIARWILGSVAERTVRIATRPVAIVPSGRPQPASLPLRVLVGLEGGPAGARAVDVVRELRRTRPCDVTMLHFYWPIGEYQRLGLTGARDRFTGDPEVIRNLEPGLRKHLDELPGKGSVELSIRPAWGNPAANLLSVADEGGYQILVVGAEQRHGFARLAQPSVSERVARQNTGAVVICVPQPAGAVSAPVAPEVPHFSTVLAPTDLSAAGNSAIPYAYALLAAHGGVVELCHVHHRTVPGPPYAFERPRHRIAPALVAELERQLRALIPPFAEALGVTTHVSVIEGRAPAEAIVQASERLAVDAISLSARGGGPALSRALLGSVAHRVAQTSRKPVLVAPGPDAPAG